MSAIDAPHGSPQAALGRRRCCRHYLCRGDPRGSQPTSGGGRVNKARQIRKIVNGKTPGSVGGPNVGGRIISNINPTTSKRGSTVYSGTPGRLNHRLAAQRMFQIKHYANWPLVIWPGNTYRKPESLRRPSIVMECLVCPSSAIPSKADVDRKAVDV